MGSIVAIAGTVLMCAAFSLAQLIVARSKSLSREFWCSRADP
jgi:hypothetical protein